MKIYRSLTVGILSLSLVFSGITSAFAAEKKEDNSQMLLLPDL